MAGWPALMYEISREFSTDFLISPSELFDAAGNDLRKEIKRFRDRDEG
jgi:hypothetical protein